MPFEITINDKVLPCITWETIEEPRQLERHYDVGYVGGMGVFAEDIARAPDQFYIAEKFDTTTFPYVRLPKQSTKVDVANISGNNPSYGFVAEDSGAEEYLFVVSGRFAYKIQLSDNTLANTAHDFGAGTVIGRPTLFEGFWYVPLGDTKDWVKLATVATGASADTWSTATTEGAPALSRRATHFANHMQEGTAQIARSHNNNASDTPVAGVESCLVGFSADGVTFGAGFEVGDTSLPITHMESIAGELFIAKPDSPWRVSEDGGGNAYPVMDFVGKAQYLSGYTGEDGSNSGSWGNFGYFTHSSGLWRIAGDHATPIDPMSDPRWTGLALDSLIPSFYGRWASVVTYGRWMYAANDVNVFAGYILEDGSVRWQGIIFENGFFARVILVPNKTNPMLWILDSNADIHRIDLNEDGSTREITTPGTLRGEASTTSQLWMPETAFGEKEKVKQLRYGYFDMDDFEDEHVTVSIRVHRDRNATATAVGSGVASGSGQNGLHEVSMTPGTTDTFRRLIPALRFVTGASYAPATSDPRCRAWGLIAMTPHVYRAVLPLDSDGVMGLNSGARDHLFDLRNLKSGASITIREPGINATFTGYIRDVREKVFVDKDGTAQYGLTLIIERWVL